MVVALPPPTLIVGLLSVRVPVVAPIAIVVPAPPMFRVVAVELRRLNVVWLVVRSPPFIATSPVTVVSPVKRDVPSIVRVPFACMFPVLVRVVPVDP